jgi:hypothetical protein
MGETVMNALIAVRLPGPSGQDPHRIFAALFVVDNPTEAFPKTLNNR